MDWFWMPVIVCAIIFLTLVIGGISRKKRTSEMPQFLGDIGGRTYSEIEKNH